MPSFNAFYAQSGGVTSVINASAAGVIERARKHKEKIAKVYAGKNGIIGALLEDLIDTSYESDDAISQLNMTPASAFGSCRYKLQNITDGFSEYERLMSVFDAHNIRYFFYNGGGDSADTCLKISQVAEKLGYPLQAIHIPKTIDNDLVYTDNCPGFGSVAKYVATSTLESSLDVASMCSTSTKVFILEVMGRHAGWIAAAGGLASTKHNQLPIIILFPEIPFDEISFLTLVEKKVKKFGYVTVVVSEGTRSSNGTFLSSSGAKDAFGHSKLGGAAPVIAQYIHKHLKYKYHYAISDYLQRSARHISSATDLSQSYQVGAYAVELALLGYKKIMISIKRTSNSPYQWKVSHADLTKVANKEKMMPRNYISNDGFGITKACREYLTPLIIGESPPQFEGGIPNYIRLKNRTVTKKLAKFNL